MINTLWSVHLSIHWSIHSDQYTHQYTLISTHSSILWSIHSSIHLTIHSEVQTDSVCSSDGFMQIMMARCDFNSTDLNDIEYIESYIYNKLEYIRFSSSVGEFVGFTEHGVKNAERLNKDKSILAQRRAEKERYCKNHVDNAYSQVLDQSGEFVFVTSTHDIIILLINLLIHEHTNCCQLLHLWYI